MVRENIQDNMVTSGGADARVETESSLDINDHLMEILQSNRLAERIIDAARLAVEQDVFEAQMMPSAVEAEDSTYCRTEKCTQRQGE